MYPKSAEVLSPLPPFLPDIPGDDDCLRVSGEEEVVRPLRGREGAGVGDIDSESLRLGFLFSVADGLLCCLGGGETESLADPPLRESFQL